MATRDANASPGVAHSTGLAWITHRTLQMDGRSDGSNPGA